MADTRRLPDAVVVIDMKKEALAVREARRLNIPVVGLVDTNCDPDDADFVIPGNDDAIRSTDLIVRVLADAVAAGQGQGREGWRTSTPAPTPRPADGREAETRRGDGEPRGEAGRRRRPRPPQPRREAEAERRRPGRGRRCDRPDDRDDE